MIQTGRARSVYIPEAIDQRLMSRFLAKVALAVLAEWIIHIDGWNEEIVDCEALGLLRRFARVDDRPERWPFSRRRIYGEDDVHGDCDGYQVLHEFMILCEPLPEPGHFDLCAIVCVFGEEFARMTKASRCATAMPAPSFFRRQRQPPRDQWAGGQGQGIREGTGVFEWRVLVALRATEKNRAKVDM